MFKTVRKIFADLCYANYIARVPYGPDPRRGR